MAHHDVAMPPKRLARSVSSSTSFSSSSKQSSPSPISKSNVRPSVASLNPKPCHACGRIITPRAKWAKDWDGIRFCSDACKSWKAIIPLKSILQPSSLSSMTQMHTVIPQELSIMDFVRWEKKKGEPMYTFWLNAYVEACLFDVASKSAPSAKRSLYEVEESITLQLHSCIPELKDGITNIFTKPPGQHEIIKRAARRLVILPFQQSALYNFISTSSQDMQGSISRSYLHKSRHFGIWHGKKRLQTLEDVSFAKGTVEVGLESY